MGFWDDVFGVSSPPAPASDGLFDSLFGGESSSRSTEQVPFGGYGEPILPTASQATGYGGQRFSSQAEADKSRLQDYGVVKDPVTGYVGTPAQIYDKYVAEGRDPRELVRRYHKW